MIGLNCAATTFFFWHCSCELCNRGFERQHGYSFPEFMARRRDLEPRLPGGPSDLHAAYASAQMPDETFFRDSVKRAGWKLLMVSSDGGVNTREVAVCPDCLERWYGRQSSPAAPDLECGNLRCPMRAPYVPSEAEKQDHPFVMTAGNVCSTCGLPIGYHKL